MEVANEFGWRTARVKFCDVCGKRADLIHDVQLYGKPIHDWPFHWWCPACKAHIGCKKGTDIPLKAMDSLQIKKARIDAHRWFDRLWKTRDERTRAYQWLAEQMKLTEDECHIAKMTLEQCQQVIRLSKERYKKDHGL